MTLTLNRRGAYTNLDYVEGLVKLDITSSEHIENVTVKVEGQSLNSVEGRVVGIVFGGRRGWLFWRAWDRAVVVQEAD